MQSDGDARHPSTLLGMALSIVEGPHLGHARTSKPKPPAYHAIRRIRPDTCVLVASGYDESATERFGPDPLPVVLEKPLGLASLRETLIRLLSPTAGR